MSGLGNALLFVGSFFARHGNAVHQKLGEPQLCGYVRKFVLPLTHASSSAAFSLTLCFIFRHSGAAVFSSEVPSQSNPLYALPAAVRR